MEILKLKLARLGRIPLPSSELAVPIYRGVRSSSTPPALQMPRSEMWQTFSNSLAMDNKVRPLRNALQNNGKETEALLEETEWLLR